MGGTSFEVGLILAGQAHIANSTWVGRHEIALPSVSVRTVGAGSGSLATVAAGLLRVGPESAGTVPGPACYGAGGTLPTVADADLALGYLNPDNFLGGRRRLDPELARRAIETHVAKPLGLRVEQAAEGIKTIIDSRMADLIRHATVEQGYDPTEFVLYAYGGAGPTHAFSYGAELGIKNIVVPVTASVHSAFGIAVSDLMVAEELSDPEPAGDHEVRRDYQAGGTERPIRPHHRARGRKTDAGRRRGAQHRVVAHGGNALPLPDPRAHRPGAERSHRRGKGGCAGQAFHRHLRGALRQGFRFQGGGRGADDIPGRCPQPDHTADA
jgi:N-methylhydantoinase A/oxoprolinase/acetone carboxylase beta subunit